ncbi:MAG: TetR/AcrR family transcriptional regulator, partial [Armatimonadetes bacterium]|nr:TetR/AcrR family transcriptional regulator [Armatimonadota bacterium]
SMEQIAATAGVSKSNVYYHFPTKEDVGIAVLESHRGDFEAVVQSTLLCQDVAATDRLQAMLSLLAGQRTVAQLGCPFGNLAAEMSEHSERLRCYLSGMFEAMTEPLAVVVAEAQSSGSIRSDIAPRTAAALMVQTAQGVQLISKCNRSCQSATLTLQALMRLLRAPASTGERDNVAKPEG